MPISIARITTGMSLCQTFGPGKCTPTGRTGPSTQTADLRFDAEKVLLDPYGLAVAVPATYDRWAAARPGDNVAVAMKSVVADPGLYDWEGDLPLKRPFAETVIYELHVRALLVIRARASRVRSAVLTRD